MDRPPRISPGKAAGKAKISYCSKCGVNFAERYKAVGHYHSQEEAQK